MCGEQVSLIWMDFCGVLCFTCAIEKESHSTGGKSAAGQMSHEAHGVGVV